MSRTDPYHTEIFQGLSKVKNQSRTSLTTDESDLLVCGHPSDFRGSTSAGLHGLLVRREGDFSDGAKRDKTEVLEGVRVISRLEEAVGYVRAWNDRCVDGAGGQSI